MSGLEAEQIQRLSREKEELFQILEFQNKTLQFLQSNVELADKRFNDLFEQTKGLPARCEELERERLEIQRAIASEVLEDPTEDDDEPYSLFEILNYIRSVQLKQDIMRDVCMRRYLKGHDPCDKFKEKTIQSRREVEQILGKALGYPWYKDDQKNFPGATEADGVCIGEQVVETLAEEAAERIKISEKHELELYKLETEISRLTSGTGG